MIIWKHCPTIQHCPLNFLFPVFCHLGASPRTTVLILIYEDVRGFRVERLHLDDGTHPLLLSSQNTWSDLRVRWYLSWVSSLLTRKTDVGCSVAAPIRWRDTSTRLLLLSCRPAWSWLCTRWHLSASLTKKTSVGSEWSGTGMSSSPDLLISHCFGNILFSIQGYGKFRFYVYYFQN